MAYTQKYTATKTVFTPTTNAGPSGSSFANSSSFTLASLFNLPSTARNIQYTVIVGVYIDGYGDSQGNVESIVDPGSALVCGITIDYDSAASGTKYKFNTHFTGLSNSYEVVNASANGKGWATFTVYYDLGLPMSFKIDGAKKDYADGKVKIDGVLKEIDSAWTKVDGVLRKL